MIVVLYHISSILSTRLSEIHLNLSHCFQIHTFQSLYYCVLPSKFQSEKGDSKMSRTGENIYKRKDGRWEGRYIKSYTAVGKAKYGFVYSRSYSEVRTKLCMAKAGSIKQVLGQSYNLSFCEFADKWLERIKLDCKTSTYNKYRNAYEKKLKSIFGKYPITRISGEMIDEFITALLTNGRNDGKPFSRKSVQEICMVIKQILLYAEENYNIKAQFSLKKLSLKKERKEVQVISSSSIQSLCCLLLTDINLYKVGILISLYTGVRIGEVCAIQWKDISFEDELLHISKTAQRVQQLDNPFEKTRLCISSPKSSCSNRTIPLPKKLLNILLPFKSNAEAYILSGKSKCVDPRTMQYHFKKYLKECGIKDTAFHTLRHTFATRCIEIGFDVKTLSEIMGHSSVNVTLDRYVHSSLKMKQELMNKLIIEF